MSNVLRLSPEIEGDVLEAVDYYSGVDLGLAERFVEEFDRTLRLIETYPLAGRVLYGDVRRMVLDAFPYLLTYRVEGEQIRVQLLAHARRSPTWIRETIRDRH